MVDLKEEEEQTSHEGKKCSQNLNFGSNEDHDGSGRSTHAAQEEVEEEELEEESLW